MKAGWQKFADFMVDIGPSIFGFAKALFQRHKGDAAAARRDIESRTDEMKQIFIDAEQAIRDKHATGETDG